MPYISLGFVICLRLTLLSILTK